MERSLKEYDEAEIIAKSQFMPPIVCGVYFLIREQQVIYVGQSVDVFARVVYHARERTKIFDRYTVVGCQADELDKLEAHYIGRFNPPLNAVVPTNEAYKSLAQIKKAYDVSALVLKAWIAGKKIPYQRWYNMADFAEFTDFLRWMSKENSSLPRNQYKPSHVRQYLGLEERKR